MLCLKCQRDLPLEEFSKHKIRGKQAYCKSCYRKIVYDFYRGLKRELIEYMGGKCARCGLTLAEVDNVLGVFVIDHIIPPPKIGKKRTGAHNTAGRASMGVITKTRVKELKKEHNGGNVQLLCQNCNAIKSSKNKDARNRYAGTRGLKPKTIPL